MGFHTVLLKLFLSDYFFFQIQVSWFQHDLGHFSVFRETKWNRLLHIFLMGVVKVSVDPTNDSWS